MSLSKQSFSVNSIFSRNEVKGFERKKLTRQEPKIGIVLNQLDFNMFVEIFSLEISSYNKIMGQVDTMNNFQNMVKYLCIHLSTLTSHPSDRLSPVYLNPAM